MKLFVVRMVCVALLLAATGCEKRKGQTGPAQPAAFVVPLLGEVLVRNMGDPGHELPPGVVFDDAELTETARAQLKTASIFASGSEDSQPPLPPKAQVLVGYAVENVWHEGKGLAQATVKLRVGIKPHQIADPAWAEDVEASGEIPYEAASPGEAPPRAFTTLVSRMVSDLLSEYIGRQSLRQASPDDVIRTLLAGPSAKLEDAIRIAGQRQLKQAVEPLLQLLNNDEETIRDAALGALVTLREPRAVSVVAESRSMRDTREMRKIITAIGILGGPEAIDYLKFVADGHEDQDIRNLATESLRRIKR